MANFDFLEKAAQKVYEEFKIEDVIVSHNNREDPNAYTFPVASDDIGKVEKPKTGYGVVLNVQVKTKRDIIGRRIWDALDPERVREIFQEAYAEQEMAAEIEDLQYMRDQGWSAGARTILLETYPLKKDGTRPRWPKVFVIALKGLKNDAADPHELMTATLIAMGNVYNPSSLNTEKKMQDLTEDIAANASKVNGAKTAEIRSIAGDYVNLAKALTVSNYVVKLLKIEKHYKIDKVYQTGAKWDKQIKAFKGFNAKQLQSQDFIIKAYNSSDLIVEFSKDKYKHFWGLSLKKKGIGRTEPDPTLLNKPVVGQGTFTAAKGKGTRSGYLTYKLGLDEGRELLAEESKFWKGVYEVKFGFKPKGTRLTWMRQLDNVLSGDDKTAALTGGEWRGKKYPDNSYFEEIDKAFKRVFTKQDNFKEFLDIVFRINIDNYVNKEEFHFSLITGSGDLRNDGVLQVNNPNEKSSVLMNEVFGKLFGRKGITDKDYIVEKMKGKKQAFERGATSAKLFYTMKIGRTGRALPIVNLEVRYKGAITSNPQFQVFVHTNFQRFMAAAKRQLGSKHAF